MTEEPKGPPKIDLEDILAETGADREEGSVLEVDELQVVGMEPAEAVQAPSGEEPAALEELRERHLRLQADFENFRKRVAREKADLTRIAGADLVRQLLPVLDNIERALGEAGEGGEPVLREGLALIHRQAMEVLGRAGLESMDAIGHPFDPEFHEAVERQTTSEFPHLAIMEEFQKGYTFQGKLLRAAMVRVAYRPDSDNPGGSEEG